MTSKAREPPKQNLSGHVCFDVPTTRFFQEVNAKVHKLETRRKFGLHPEKVDRNPLRAEKSPRQNDHFEYNPPPANPEPERWNYPKSDWGLMAKFVSQKAIYEQIAQKDAEYHSQVNNIARIRQENTKMIEDERRRQQEQYDYDKKLKEKADRERFDSIMGFDSGIVSGHNKNKLHEPDELDQALQRDAEAAQRAHEEKLRKKKGHKMLLTLMQEPELPKDFYKAKITSFRSIGEQHPEVLAEWRAHRASKYVDKHGSLLPPEKRELGTRSFRPAGILPAGESAFQYTHGETVMKVRPISPSTQAEIDKVSRISNIAPLRTNAVDIRVIAAELAKTEELIDRQQLKIKLNTKPLRRFQVPKDERASSRRLARDRDRNSLTKYEDNSPVALHRK